ncbi:MAG: outer membrane beta-barrel protein [Bacteroides sp.]
MKTIKQLSIKLVALVAVSLAFALPIKAQISPNSYYNVDWQFNIPLNNSFADKASGWGMNFEGGYYVIPRMSVGAFLNYHTNNEYVGRETFTVNSSSVVTTDQQHSIFQLPFGASLRYRFSESICQPYVGLKLGANYTRTSSSFYVLKATDNQWGFYMSPEVGVNIYPFMNNSIGFHIAAFYSYSTNKSAVLHYNVDALNNVGFRLGLAF